MNAPHKLPLLSDFCVGDRVRTPSLREATVVGVLRERLDLRYLDDGDAVLLLPHLLTLEQRAEPHAISRFFLHDIDRVREGRA